MKWLDGMKSTVQDKGLLGEGRHVRSVRRLIEIVSHSTAHFKVDVQVLNDPGYDKSSYYMYRCERLITLVQKK